MHSSNDTTPIIPPADRIATTTPYYFLSLEQRLAELRSKNIEIIRLDMGSPDMPPDDSIINAFTQSIHNPNNHGYSVHGGTSRLKETIAKYYLRQFNVSLNPASQILALLGTKEGLFHLSQAVLNPGDISLVPDPGYPVYANSSKIAGAEIYGLPLTPENYFLPELSSIPTDICERAKILWLNYPNNPTGAIAPDSFYNDAIQFAQQNHILIVHDAAYIEVSYGCRAKSILQFPSAFDVAIEFNSFSKTYNMAGWRIGMAVGNQAAVSYLSKYKSQADSSMFIPIMEAAETALSGDQSWIPQRNAIYKSRRDYALQAYEKAGLNTYPPAGSLYIWTQIPDNYKDCEEFCNHILDTTHVTVTPGKVYGNIGTRYFRTSLTTETRLFKKGIDQIINHLG